MAAAGVTIVPRHVLGGVGFQAPSDTVNVAGIGVGGMGRSNMTALASQNIVALCDVDWDYAGQGLRQPRHQRGQRCRSASRKRRRKCARAWKRRSPT